MPFCPKCRSEYRPEHTLCADCGVALIEKLEDPTVPSPDPGDDLVVVHSFDNPAAASVLVSRLEAEGIQSVILDAETVGMNPLWSAAVGGVKVAVRKADGTQAISLVREAMKAPKPESEEEQPDTAGEEGMGRACPHCNSTKTYRETVSSRAAALSILLLGFPLLLRRGGWKCSTCCRRFKKTDQGGVV